MNTGLAELLGQLRAAANVADCLNALIASRDLAGTRIVGFREERHLPAVTRLPRPVWWAERMGWPRGFVQEWIRLNFGQIDPSLGGAALRPGRLARWQLPAASDLAAMRGSAASRVPAIEFLLRHGVDRGVVAAVRRRSGAIGFVSWLVPARALPELTPTYSRSLLLFAEMFFEALDRVRPPDPLALLSPPERRCLAWAAYGCTDKEIAGEIGRSTDTVRFHMKNVLKKLGAANRTHAVAVGIQKGIIRLGSTPHRLA
jgi:LuxR family quorum-sensing system transcriptional regulator CciR